MLCFIPVETESKLSNGLSSCDFGGGHSKMLTNNKTHTIYNNNSFSANGHTEFCVNSTDSGESARKVVRFNQLQKSVRSR